MSRDVTVTFSDESSHVFKGVPDNVTPEQVTERAVAEFGKSVTALNGGRSEFVGETARVLDKSIRGGIFALPNLLRHGLPALSSALPEDFKLELPKAIPDAVVKAYDAITTPQEPKTPMGKAVGNVGESVVSAMLPLGGVIAPVRSAITGLAAGVGAEGSAKLFGDNALSRIVGGLAGGLTGGIATAAKTNRAALAQEALADTRPADLAVAHKRMVEAAKAGLPINLSQAMPRASNIDAYVDALANSRHGVKTAEMLRAQPAQVGLGVEDQLANLPGTIRAPQILANNVQEGATKAISDGVAAAGKAWQKAAPQGSLIPEQVVGQLDNRLALMGKQYGPKTPERAMFEDVRANLLADASGGTPASKILNAQGLPVTPAGQGPKYMTDALMLKGAIDRALETFGSRQLNTPGLSSKDLRRAQEIRELFTGVIDKYAPKLSAANQAYNTVMEGIVDPLKKSVVGRMAGRQGASDVLEAPQARLFSVFEKGTVPGSTSSEILTLERSLRQAGHAADFQDAAKTWLAGKVSTALKSTDNRMPDDIAGKLRVVFGDPRQLDQASKGFEDVLAGLARSQGVPQAPYIKGFQSFMEIVSNAARRPQSVSGITPSGVREAASEGIFKRLGQVSIMTPIRQPALKWASFLEADALGVMDKLLTSPEGIATLVKLGKQPRMSHTAISTIATFLGTAAAVDNSSDVTAP